MKFFLPLSAAAALLPMAFSWGAAGHEMVATIAQIHLHPDVRAKLCDILPATAHCHLAPIAAWADQVRGRYPETGPMHYVNPKLDHPGDHCEYGESGWIDEDVNVLTAIMNKTQAVIDGDGDIPLRFLVHFIADLHQPLHLTGRDKGGNGALFRFEGRARNLHSVWDSGIITKNIRELSNYTTPVPSKQVESALLGAIFDPYVRWIVWEGIREWWRDDLASWIACPATGDPYPHSSLDSTVPAPHRTTPHRPSWLEKIVATSALAVSVLPDPIRSIVAPLLPLPAAATEHFAAQQLAASPAVLAAQNTSLALPACPFTWSEPLHSINCDVAWPKEYTGDHSGPLIELDTDQYLGRIGREKIVEKLLAMAGLRLAKVLNEALGAGQYGSLYFDY